MPTPPAAPMSGGWRPAHTPPPHTPPQTPRRQTPRRQTPPPTAAWRPGPGPRPPGPYPPPYSPPAARPGGVVVAFVLQLISGGLFLLGSFLGFLGVNDGGTAAAVVGLTLLSALYLTCAFLAFGGRGWARLTLAVINGLFVVFCLAVIGYGMNDVTSSSGARAGGVVILLLLAGMAVACTVPMFTGPARAYARARKVRL